MKIVISVIGIVILMIGAQSASAGELKDAPFSKQPKADILSGFKHGVADGKCAQTAGCSDYYITQPGKGFAFHTRDFITGFVKGYCSTVWPPTDKAASDAGFDADEASFSCKEGPNSAIW